ncbi:MAG: hypothetical protein ACO20H_05790 [Bacteriovoracaceae bacterium]
MRKAFIIISTLTILGSVFYFSKEKSLSSIYRRPLLGPIEYAPQFEDSVQKKEAVPKRGIQKVSKLNEFQRTQIVEEIFAESALEEHLTLLESIIEKKLQYFSSLEYISNSESSQLIKTIKENLNKEKLKSFLKKEFHTTLSDNQLVELNNQTHPPVIKKINEQAMDIEKVLLMDDYSWSKTLETYPLRQQRRLILSQLDHSTKTSVISTKILLFLYKDLLNSVGKKILPEVPEELNLSDIESIGHSLHQEAHENIIETFHILYKDFSDDELLEFLAVKKAHPNNLLPLLYLNGIDNFIKQQGQN